MSDINEDKSKNIFVKLNEIANQVIEEEQEDYSPYDESADYGEVKELPIDLQTNQSRYKLHPPSDEQVFILKNVEKGLNIKIRAVAGSGKTTTTLHIAKHIPHKNILLLTYNAKLKKETREKVVNLGIKNMEVHNFHAFGVKYYGPECQRDAGLRKALKNPQKFDYDVIIIDEAQDITPLFYKFANHICNEKTQLIIMGDKRQSIYVYNGSWSEYLTKAHKIFTKNKNPWINLKLNISFRVTHQTAKFINEVFFDKQIITGFNNGPEPTVLLFKSYYEEINLLFDIIVDLIKVKKYKPEDILILAASVKPPVSGQKHNPISKITNKLSKEHDFSIFVPMSDTSEPAEKVMVGKIACLTFHQSKGLERKIVFVFGSDSSYFRYYARLDNTEEMPNTMYVAMTRSSEHLYLVSFLGKAPPNRCFNFANVDNILPYIKTEFNEPGQENKDLTMKYDYLNNGIKLVREENKIITYGVTSLLRNINEKDLEYCMKYIKIQNLQPKEKEIELQSVINTENNQCEEVSDINGTAIPEYYCYTKTKTLPIGRNFLKPRDKYNGTISHLLELSNKYNCLMSGYKHTLKQIKRYTWLPHRILTECIERMKIQIGENTQDEVKLCYRVLPNIDMVGAIDCIYDDTIWEFKCVKEIRSEHYIQLALYAYLYAKNVKDENIKPMKYKLFNIRSNQIDEIFIEEVNILHIIEYIIGLKSKDHNAIAKSKFNKILLKS